MKGTCKHCGEEFTHDKEDVELWNDGYIELPRTCSDCFSMQEGSQDFSYEQHSDADPGL